MSALQAPVPAEVDPLRRPHLTLQLRASGGVTVVTVTGEVDADNAHLIPELVDCVGAKQVQRLVLELAQVTFICAAGVEALLRVRDSVGMKAGRLVLRNPSPIVMTVLAGTRVLRGFQIHTTGRDQDQSAVPTLPRRTGS